MRTATIPAAEAEAALATSLPVSGGEEESVGTPVEFASLSKRAPDPKPSPEPAAPLPSLDVVVESIQPQVRELLEDLFRAKFTAVRRLPDKAFKQP